MAPIKFEEQIKEKLEQRKIQPSNMAWDQLSEKLDVEEKKSSRRLFFYVGIAASVVGILLMTNLMFKASDYESVVPTVVDAQEEVFNETTPNAEINQMPNKTIVETASQNNSSVEINEQILTESSSIKNEPLITDNIEQPEIDALKTNDHLIKKDQWKGDTQETIASTSLVTEEEIEQVKVADVIKPVSTLTIEESKAIEVVAKIEKLKVENGYVTDLEIENLLKQAEKEILKSRIFNESTRTVDADALLQDVEKDIETSFRSKVFESLKSSYKTVKTAVAGRNN